MDGVSVVRPASAGYALEPGDPARCTVTSARGRVTGYPFWRRSGSTSGEGPVHFPILRIASLRRSRLCTYRADATPMLYVIRRGDPRGVALRLGHCLVAFDSLCGLQLSLALHSARTLW